MANGINGFGTLYDPETAVPARLERSPCRAEGSTGCLAVGVGRRPRLGPTQGPGGARSRSHTPRPRQAVLAPRGHALRSGVQGLFSARRREPVNAIGQVAGATGAIDPERRVAESCTSSGSGLMAGDPVPGDPVRSERRPALNIVPWVWHLVYAFSRLLLAVPFRMRVSGAERAPKGPVLLACKHVSAWDIPIGAYLSNEFFGRKAYFQMGSFIGYPVFGRIVPVLRACGGFSVLRPKEVLRLRKTVDRERIHALMDEVNGVAEATRQAVLESGGVLVVFPEGTRDAGEVRPVRSHREIESALTVEARGHGDARPVIVPAAFNYGPKRFFRRRLDVEIGEPIPLDGATATEIAARVEATLRAMWRRASD